MTAASRQDLRKRTKEFALRIIKLYAALPRTTEAQVLGKQILRSGTSVGAHYREACRDAKIVTPTRLAPLVQETNELIAMFVTMAKGVKQKKAGVVIPHPSALIP